jgi:putative phage-type endonuclease
MAIERRKIVDREEWLAWRREDVTASAIGALFGAHPYQTKLRLWAEKRGVEFLDNDNKTMRRGRWLEPAVAEATRELRANWRIEPAKCYLHDPEHRIGASPDFWIHGDPRGLGVLQCKTAAHSVFKRDWADGADVPMWITLQTATEMMLADAAFGAVAVLLVDPFDMDCFIHEVPRNAAADAKIIKAVDAFWKDVDEDREPELDPRRDAETVRALTAKSVEGKVRDLSGNNELPIPPRKKRQSRPS